MKVTIKTLQQKSFQLDAEPADLVGKILADDKPLSDYNITEKDFLVVMVTKPKAAPTASTSSAPAVTPAPVLAPTPTIPVAAPPVAQPAPVPVAAPEPISTPITETTSFDASTLATGGAFESAVTNLVEMGFERSEVIRAMRAAFNNPDRAAEYLMTGIPESIAREFAPSVPTIASTPVTPATAGAPATTAPASGYVNLFEEAAQQAQQRTGAAPATAGLNAGAGANTLASLRNSPQFQQLRQLVQAQPHLLEPMMQSLAQSNPQILQLISQNQDAFLQLLNEEGEDGDDEEFLAALGDPGVGAGAGGAGGRTVIQITPEENEAITRLVALGFDRDAAVVAYLTCDKNEELAANFLFEQGDDMQ
ncbi:hypothetical protein HK096_004480 [Nowakowskiella sp. JEL0078]|nr:hypothetical protein HK096_004480 [Nowakowskiella sp. JEL0078]